jgi:hypothetical protein
VAEEGGDENEVVQLANVAANAAANPLAKVAANAAANAAGNVTNNNANVAGAQQQNVVGNARQNAGSQPQPAQAAHAWSNQRQPIRDEAEIASCAYYDRDNKVPDPLDANHPIQATDLRQMHDQEFLRHAQYDQDNGPPDDLYVIPTAYAPSPSPGTINNFLAFS